MRIIFILFAMIAVCAAKVAAQSGDFFIPQQAIEVMNQTEQLPPLRIRQPQRHPTENTNQPQAPSAKITSPEQPKQPSTQIADKKNNNPVAVKQSEKSSSLPSDTNNQKPLQAQKPMMPQTGTPAIPVYADNPDTPNNINKPQATPGFKEPPLPNTDNTKALTPSKDIASEDSPLTYDRIIAEYNRDILKISKNLPAENKRLQEVLEKYHDETITF